MPIPCNSVHRFCQAGQLERRGQDNAREFGFSTNTRADAASAQPDAGTVEIVADPMGGDFNTLRLDSDLSGSSWGADLTMDMEWKRPGRADGGGTTNNVQQFSPYCVAAQCAILSASFGAASTGYITIFNAGTTTSATIRELELRVFRDGSANLVNRTTGPTVSLTAGTIPTNGTRFLYYIYYRADPGDDTGRIEFGVSTNGGSSWTTSTSTDASITNSPTRRFRLMARAESTQVSLLDSGVPEVCYDWFGVACAFLGNGASSIDTSSTVADLRTRATYNPFFDFKTGGVTSDGFTISCSIKDDDFDSATAPDLDYEVYEEVDPGDYEPSDPFPVDPGTGDLVDSGTLTIANATTRFASARVTGLTPYTYYFVKLTAAGVDSHWVRVRTAHTASEGRKTINLGFFAHIQNTGEKRPCIAANWIDARNLDELICVGKRWHNDNNGDRSPGVSLAKAADLYQNSAQDVFLTSMFQNTPFQPLFAEYEWGWTNCDSRYAGSASTMGTVDANWNYDNTGSGGDRGDTVTAGTAWTAYTDGLEATIGPFAVDEPTAGCLYYARTRGRVKFLHLAERLYRTAGGDYLGADQINWAEGEIAEADGCELVVVLSASSWSDEDATADDSYGSATWSNERDAALGRFAVAARDANKKLLFVSDAKFTPYLLTTAFSQLAGDYASSVLGCVGLGKTAGRVPVDYDPENFVVDDTVSPKTARSGVSFNYLALADADADQNDLTCPISGATTGVDTDDSVVFWGELSIDESAKTVRIRAFNGITGVVLSDATFGDFDFTLSYASDSVLGGRGSGGRFRYRWR